MGILDVESELQEAMSETVDTEEHCSLLDGSRKSLPAKNSQLRGHGKSRHGNTQVSSQLRMDSGSTPEEEFFCLTPEDSRSIISTASGGSGRSRNASSTSTTSAVAGGKHINMKPNHTLPVQMGLPDTKIFSVAVEAKPAEHTGTDTMVVCDVDTDYAGRFAVVSSCYPNKPSVSDYQRKEPVDKIDAKTRSEEKTKMKNASEKGKTKTPHYSLGPKNNVPDIMSLSTETKECSSGDKDMLTSSKSSKALDVDVSQKMIPIDIMFPEKESSPPATESVKESRSGSLKNEQTKTNKKGKKKKKGSNALP